MSYLLALLQRPELTVATTHAVVPPQDLPPLQDALALADQLSALLASQHEAVARAQAEGRASGEAAGFAAGQTRALDEGAHTLAEQLQRIAAEQAAQREELRHALVALATGMVRRMAADLAPAQVLAALAERAFDHVVPPQPVRLRLPPAQVDAVRAQLALRELALPVQCTADDSLHGLDCVVESSAGSLLAGLDAVLEQTSQALATSLRTSPGEGTQGGTEAAPTRPATEPLGQA